MASTYNAWLVALSIGIAILASYTALDLASRVAFSTARAKRYWLVGGSFAMGTGIWSMHFIGMLAFHLPIPLAYDIPLTLASMVVAVAASGLALLVVQRGNQDTPTLLASAVLMGAGIATMHYTGMAAMKMQPPIHYDPWLFALSVAIAIGASLVALRIAFRLRSPYGASAFIGQKLGSAIAMGAAIAGMHYTGMAAAIFAPGSICSASPQGIDPGWLAALVGTASFLILVLTLAASIFDARLADQSANMVKQLEKANSELQQRASALAEAMTEEIRTNASRNRMLAAIVEQSSEAIITRDCNDVITSWNNAAARMFGYLPEEAIGMSAAMLRPPESGTDGHDEALTRVKTPESVFIEARRIAKDGAILDVAASVSPLYDEDGRHIGAISIIRDITLQKRNEEALFEEKERAQVTLASIGDAVITTDARGRVEYLNLVAEELTGWHTEEASGLPLPEVFRIINEHTRNPVENPVEKCLREGRVVGLANHTLLINREGREVAIEDSAAPIRNRTGEIIGVVMVFHDVSKARTLAKRLSWQANHDMLTGLSNRFAFENRLNHLIAGALEDNQQHALLYLDLDQFKVVNDTCGHMAGDELLKQLGILLQGKMRESDMLARLGGDEFGVLLLNCPIGQARRIANEIRNAVQDYRFSWRDKSFAIGVSIGVVSIHAGSHQLADVLSKADVACYAAKEAGRNRVHVYEAGNFDMERQHGEMQWVSRITKAIEENHLALYYQAIKPICGHDRGPAHCEILLRMVGDSGDIIAPAAFLPAAERYGLMPAVDRWVIQRVFEWLKKHQADHVCTGLFSINLSGHSLSDEKLVEFVMAQFGKTGIPPEKICFEITETAAIANLGGALRFINVLKKRGCSFALDDFGSGLSSFAYLKTLPVDYLKIDGGFVKDIERDPIDHAMVEAISRIGQVMGISTIAEFVENDAILERLRTIGVNFAQGYGIAVPQRLDGD
ncbi:MAG: EAL domain-containing protein [Pseudomonadota bacterium]|jgi:diguanylate cyclase (GGDEF)-like protein/PAS domain S-box-containing protein